MHCGSMWAWQHSTCAAKAGTFVTDGGLRTLVFCCNMKQHPKKECIVLADDGGCHSSFLARNDKLELCTCSNSMALIHFWEAGSFSASQEFSTILRNPNVPYRVYVQVPLHFVFTLNQINPALHLGFSSSPFLQFSPSNPLHIILRHVCSMPRPYHAPCFDDTNCSL
jgi:hypothetical protein